MGLKGPDLSDKRFSGRYVQKIKCLNVVSNGTIDISGLLQCFNATIFLTSPFGGGRDCPSDSQSWNSSSESVMSSSA